MLARKWPLQMTLEIPPAENWFKAKRHDQKYLRKALNTATSLYHQLHENDRARALKAVNRINSIRHQLHEKATELGYVQKCIESMPVCKGLCCKWHFPKNLNCLDLFVTVCSISSREQKALEAQIASDNGRYECPVLGENGCVLPFHSRPLACSNAYPCFLGDSYYEFLTKKRKEIHIQHTLLKGILQKSGGALNQNALQ